MHRDSPALAGCPGTPRVLQPPVTWMEAPRISKLEDVRIAEVGAEAQPLPHEADGPPAWLAARVEHRRVGSCMGSYP